MTDSAAAFKAEAIALANGPAPPGAYNNKMGFDEYALHEQTEYCLEVGGVLVGYAGHVPRARDKVGSNPIGNVPGTPVSPMYVDGSSGSVGIDMETGIRVLPHDRTQRFAQSFTRMGYPEKPNQYTPGLTSANYTSEARDPQNKSNVMKPHMFAQGTTPGYTGHVARVKTHSLGSSTFSTPPPGSSFFVGVWADPRKPSSRYDVELRQNAKGHIAYNGKYKLAYVKCNEPGKPPFELQAAIDDASNEMLVDFSPDGGPQDFPGNRTDSGIQFPHTSWVKWVQSQVWDDGTGGM
mmetsp:Transcript_70870/g.140476  ORF Transcript_70870/g.140476 Transcript_70870/m.140476 type:complete len:293 (-) Transcript_70870:222-1100(-)